VINEQDQGVPASPSLSQPPASDPDGSSQSGIANADALLLDELYEAAENGAFAVACDGRPARKAAWRLDRLGLARWCGTNWGSSFFAITDAGKAHVDAETSALRARLNAAYQPEGAGSNV
jgi:hypothetical protein